MSAGLPPKDGSDKRRQEVERLLAQRQRQIEDEKKRVESREAETTGRRAQEKEAFLAETGAARARAGEREEWRQAQHARAHEDEALRWKQKKEKEAQEEAKRKADEEEKLRREHTDDLHRKAYAKKIETKRATLKREEGRVKEFAAESSERRLHELALEEENAIRHLTQDARRKSTDLERTAEKRRQMLEEKRAVDKENAKREFPDSPLERGRAAMRADTEYKRDLMSVEEQLREGLSTIEADRKHLEDELRRTMADKRRQVEMQRQTRTKEAEDHRTNAERWLKGGDDAEENVL